MCGIAGFLGSFPEQLLTKFNECLAHRGPDALGQYHEASNGIGLAHRRLSIIDLTPAGTQPMWDSAKEVCITFNGEIYNFRELRKALEDDGVRFTSRTDTEVIVHLYKKHGKDMLPMLNGIFAIAIWDTRHKTLLLARDSAGTKPLYYTQTSRGLLFASEIKAFTLARDFDRTVNPEALGATLAFLWTPGPQTIFSAVSKVMPGQWLVAKDARVVAKGMFKEIRVSGTPLPGRHYEHAFMLQNELRRAVRRQMVSDVPVGAMFSGGLDSSAIVAFAREANPEADFRCFTIGFKGKEAEHEGLADDLHYAKRIASHLNVELEEITVGTEAISLLDRAVYHLDEPCPDPATLNVLLIAQAAKRQGITVLLSGVGGDDLLAGYRRHQAYAVEPLWSWLPQGIRDLMAGGGRLLPQRGNATRRISRALSQTALAGNARLASYFTWAPPATLSPVLHPQMRSGMNEDTLAALLLKTVHEIPDFEGAGRLNQMLAIDVKHFLADHNLNYVDKLSMAEGIEVRVPFLDRELIDFSFSLPASSKLRGLTGKWVLKKALEDYLPQETIHRPKAGFGAPLRHWIRNELRWLIDELISDSHFRNREIFDASGFRELVDADRAGRVDGAYSIFAVLCVELWCRQFLDHTPSHLL